MQIADNKENKFFYFPMISMPCTGSGYWMGERRKSFSFFFFISSQLIGLLKDKVKYFVVRVGSIFLRLVSSSAEMHVWSLDTSFLYLSKMRLSFRWNLLGMLLNHILAKERVLFYALIHCAFLAWRTSSCCIVPEDRIHKASPGCWPWSGYEEGEGNIFWINSSCAANKMPLPLFRLLVNAYLCRKTN